ncbi:hypothetical protein [Garciella nitratireducens]|uniref:Uncharacterized protein n=1 Tax=Garciella nitratireducens DSM 15102 TaxID=1121911 RepID=A0A1T4K7W2_9FIRM|nr:hypothetical protein [Garciella nitratireducens]SJZ38403.1 hypothetical protein SAMN02745973_00400 [Garciella nitratireducens DSM 15102]
MANEDKLLDLMEKIYGEIQNGFKAVNDKLDDIDEKIDKVQFDVNNLTMKVAQNDNTIIDLKRNLKNVK